MKSCTSYCSTQQPLPQVQALPPAHPPTQTGLCTTNTLTIVVLLTSILISIHSSNSSTPKITSSTPNRSSSTLNCNNTSNCSNKIDPNTHSNSESCYLATSFLIRLARSNRAVGLVKEEVALV